jgi:hypothetical protein
MTSEKYVTFFEIIFLHNVNQQDGAVHKKKTFSFMAITNETLEVKFGTEICQHIRTHFVLLFVNQQLQKWPRMLELKAVTDKFNTVVTFKK